jgi:hypothetical protein
MSGAYLFLAFLVCFIAGVFAVKGIETLVERKKANRRYIKHLETENQYYRQKAYFYKLELDTREV